MAGPYKDQLSMRLLPDQREAWLTAAGQAGVQNLNVWIRLILDHAAGIGEIHDHLEQAARAQTSAASRKNAELARAARQKKLKEKNG
jgi:hypothetical protein